MIKNHYKTTIRKYNLCLPKAYALIKNVSASPALQMKKIALLTALWLACPAQALPDNWQSHVQNGFTTYSPTASDDHLFLVIALDPLPLGDATLENWATHTADTLSANYGTLRSRTPEPMQGNLWSAIHTLQGKNGQPLIARYTAQALANNQARMLVLLAEDHPATVAAHISAGSELLASLLAGANPLIAPATSGDIHLILHASKTTYGVYGLSVAEHEHILYRDGRLSRDGKDAGRWQEQNQRYSDAQGKPLDGEPAIPLSAARLIGHYNGDRAGAFGNATSYVETQRFTFHENGRYEQQGGFSGAASSTLGDARSDAARQESSSHGQWRILGDYLLELTDSAGNVRQHIAYFTSDNWLTRDRHAYQRQ